jgi:hypothetical protein
VALAVLFIRKSDAFLNPQFWAEDGAVFFIQQYELGLESFFQTYSAYFHALPRLVAYAADFFPYGLAPAIYNYASLLVLLAVVWKLHSPRLELRHRHLMALAVVMVPHFTGEVFLNLTNVQWVLAALLLLVALLREPETRAQGAGDLLLIAVGGLTGPFILLLLPLFAYRAWRRRSAYRLLGLGIAAAAGAVQLAAMLKNPMGIPGEGAQAADTWTRLIGQKLFGTMFLGRLIPYSIDSGLLAVGGFLALAALLALAWTDPRRGRLVTVFLLFGAAVTAVTFYRFRNVPDLLIAAPAAARYFFLPNLMVLWSSVICFGLDGAWRKVLPVALAVLVVFSSFKSVFRTPAYEDYHWKTHAAKIDQGQPLEIPINPPGWTLKIDPEKRSK